MNKLSKNLRTACMSQLVRCYGTAQTRAKEID